jgi:hypothetical protein
LGNEEGNHNVEILDIFELFFSDGLTVIQDESRLLIVVCCIPRVSHSVNELFNRSISVTVNDAINVSVEELFE